MREDFQLVLDSLDALPRVDDLAVVDQELEIEFMRLVGVICQRLAQRLVQKNLAVPYYSAYVLLRDVPVVLENNGVEMTGDGE